MLVHLLLQLGDGGVGGEDGGFEVVDDEVAPFFDWLADGLEQVGAWRSEECRVQACIGFFGRDVFALGYADDDAIGVKVESGAFPQLVADAGGVGGAVVEEEGAVGAQPRRAFVEHGAGQFQVARIEHLQCEGGVAAAAAEAGAEGDLFLEVDGDGWHAEFVVQQAPRLHAEVVFGCVVEGDAVLYHPGRGALVDDQRVLQRAHGHEDGLDVVVAVGAFAHHMEAEVNLAVGACFLVEWFSHRRV